jgi:transposase InsO family protein
MCRTLRVTESGYYKWLNCPASKRTEENEILLKRIIEIHELTDKTYGSPRITRDLREEGFDVSRPRVARLMKKEGLRAQAARKFKVTTDSDHNYPISPNLLNRVFTEETFGTVWTSDITYIRTLEGWLYLTVVMDLSNREIVGWAMSDSLKASETTIPALRAAFERHQPLPGLIFHSDRGVQYACEAFRELLAEKQMIQSMSKTGDCYDNAVTESFFATLKKELVYRRKYHTRWQARQSIFQYIETFYNRVRKHSTLGYLSPVQFRELNQLEKNKIAA